MFQQNLFPSWHVFSCQTPNSFNIFKSSRISMQKQPSEAPSKSFLKKIKWRVHDAKP